MSYGAPYGYGSGYGYGVTGFVGILDRLSVRPYSFWSFARRAAGYYSGPVGRIYRTSDGNEKDIYGRGSLGLVDPDEIAAFAPTGNALWTKLYDQTGAGRHFEQASNLIMPYACKSGVPVTENGIQSAEFVAADARRMTVPSSQSLYNFLHTTGGDVAIVSRPVDDANSKVMLATSDDAFARPGVLLFYSSTERHSCTAARIDVAGTPTTGRSINNATLSSGETANNLAFLRVDPDAAVAANRFFGWINGTLKTGNNGSTSTPNVENAFGNLTLGAVTNASLPHAGTISEVAIWSGPATESDRQAFQASSFPLWGL